MTMVLLKMTMLRMRFSMTTIEWGASRDREGRRNGKGLVFVKKMIYEP